MGRILGFSICDGEYRFFSHNRVHRPTVLSNQPGFALERRVAFTCGFIWTYVEE